MGYRSKLRDRTPYVLTVDAGDSVQGGPVGALTDGDAVINIMNRVGYDFAVPGNHEFDYGMEKFYALSAKLSCGYTACNIMDLKTDRSLFPGYKLFSFGDTTIALVGVDTPGTIISSNPRYFQDASGECLYGFCEDYTGEKLYERIQQNVNLARALGAEKVILVGHLGNRGSRKKWSSIEVIRHTKGIDALIDGHSHEVYLEYVDNLEGKPVLLTQTGADFQNIGELTISPDGDIPARLLDEEALGGVEPDIETAQYIQLVKGALAQKLEQPIGITKVDLIIRDPMTGKLLSGETNLGDFCADAYRTVLNTDIGMINIGGVRDDIPAGTITYNDLLQVYSLGDMACVIAIKGKTLLDVLEMASRTYPEGSGHLLLVSGMSYKINAAQPTTVLLDEKGVFQGVGGARKVYDVMVGGQPLDPEKTYTAAGGDYLFIEHGSGMEMFKEAEVIRANVMPDTEILSRYITDDLGGVVGEEYADPAGQGRITG